ncbi:MAG: hypothetical protein RR646_04975 [Erysipelotrichaceae bacterium]
MNYKIEIKEEGLIYYEEDKVLLVDIDFKDIIKFISINLIENYEYPNNNIIISKEDKIRIISNIYNELLKTNDKDSLYLDID